MKIIFLLFLFALTGAHAAAQTNQYKFDFGNDKTAKGYIAVTPSTIFSSYEQGFGFHPGSMVEAIDRRGNPVKGDFITGRQPFYFSVRLPEGNYDITIMLGDSKSASSTTVRTECRRQMLEHVSMRKGIVTKKITVHVKDSLIRDQRHNIVGKVKLKPREFGYLHWDQLLTLEFNSYLPKVSAVKIKPNTKATTIFLAGNSTVVDQDREPWAAWGQMIPAFFKPGNIVVANYAESGETMRAFKNEYRLQKIFSLAKPGDYLFIEFAHNDQKPGGNHLDPFTTYKLTLKEWISEARQRGMIPVLVTSMHRRSFDSSGHIVNTLSDYPEAMRQTAAEEHVALIDLNAMSKTLYEAWGPKVSLKAFVHYPAHTFPNQETELKDNTHFNSYGAYELARCVASGIVKARLPIARYLIKWKANFDPTHPDPEGKWTWYPSALMSSTKPDGN